MPFSNTVVFEFTCTCISIALILRLFSYFDEPNSKNLIWLLIIGALFALNLVMVFMTAFAKKIFSTGAPRYFQIIFDNYLADMNKQGNFLYFCALYVCLTILFLCAREVVRYLLCLAKGYDYQIIHSRKVTHIWIFLFGFICLIGYIMPASTKTPTNQLMVHLDTLSTLTGFIVIGSQEFYESILLVSQVITLTGLLFCNLYLMGLALNTLEKKRYNGIQAG